MLIQIPVQNHTKRLVMEPECVQALDERIGTRWKKNVYLHGSALRINAMNRHSISLRTVIAETMLPKSNKKFDITISKDKDPFNLVLSNIQWTSRKLYWKYRVKYRQVTPIIFVKNHTYWATMSTDKFEATIGPYRRIDQIEPVVKQYCKEWDINENAMDTGLKAVPSLARIPGSAKSGRGGIS